MNTRPKKGRLIESENKMRPKTADRSGSVRGNAILARYADVVTAFVFCLLSAYHFTQPNAAWRSGAIELSCAIALFAAALWLRGRVSAGLNLITAGGICALAIRHLSHGEGYVSGSIELLAALFLSVAAVQFWSRR
jgi:hypothetical protein